MNIFVTGGTGFIGRRVVQTLAGRGHRLLLLTRGDGGGLELPPEARFLKGDLSSPSGLGKAMKDFRAEALVHLAWEGLPRYSVELGLRNLDHAMKLLAEAIGAGCEMIISTGSCWEYAGRWGSMAEDSPTAGVKVFPAVKDAIRSIGEAISREKGIRFHWLRLFFVYGPGQRRGSLIPSILASIEDGRKPDIRTPDNANDFVYVDDVAEAVAEVLESPSPGTVYNVGSGVSRSIREVVRIVHEALGKEFDPSSMPEKQGAPAEDFWADLSRILREVGWSPRIGIEEGILRTLAIAKASP